MPGLSDRPLLEIASALRNAGAHRVFLKVLAANDNSKNQVYLGGDYSALNMLPLGDIRGEVGSHGEPIFKVTIRFSWLTESGGLCPAPGTQLILYPQYPEVRLSGFLRASPEAPTELMNEKARIPGRILFLGVSDSGSVIAFVVAPASRAAKELQASGLREGGPLLINAADIGSDHSSRTQVIRALRRVHAEGWKPSRRLVSDGTFKECRGPNCGGYTLEAALGIAANGYAEPDYLGWELKQHATAGQDGISGATLTLMTPEPTGGVYVEKGVREFVTRYGYPDQKGRADRLNVGGIHAAGRTGLRTGLTLTLRGYDAPKARITDADGAVALIDGKGRVAASWSFGGLLKHWNRKHASAAYVQSVRKDEPSSYRFGPLVRLGEGTDFSRLLAAFATGNVYYDPGIKWVRGDGRDEVKRRSQFRVRGRDLASLYHSFETVDLT